MARRFALRSAFIASVLLAAPAVAVAQSPSCDRFRAELASLGRGGDARAAASARALRGELGRLQSYAANLGCDRVNFLFFGQPKPQQCGAIEAQLRHVSAEYNRAMAQSQGSEPRRQQLMAAIRQNCDPGSAGGRQPNFFERLFGVRPGDSMDEANRAPDDQLPTEGDPSEQRQTRYGGSRTVCVRSCDGYFFPLPTGSRDGAPEMCQALCPATETLVYFMPADGAIERAGNREGKPYTELPNASKYKRSLDPACTCRKPGESWTAALQHGEELLGPRRNDIIVTAEKAEELSRVKPVAKPAETKPADVRDKQAKTPASAEPDEEPMPDPAAVPTASHESSGIGPQTIDSQRAVGTREGQVREVIGANGQKQNVRVVAPNIFASPTTADKAE
ncbi:DUF2865 domain-containing protein [Chelatococcus reniformis]|uniref:DUF2865 domain-containing protein n=1 Tax=Chelatococcus reniformis TaxID=1494448 RepID=A0A916UHL8_9HYPH|nr:DUF2865 domain-containing protein [Chelatococcus reniformis]GGC73056.1 hypothetical protein GCM10010994_34300 [Chelatococcus reniformis]